MSVFASSEATIDASVDKSIGRSAGESPRARAERAFSGIWISEAGSRYVSDGQEFVCISVHHSDFSGWIGKTAIAGITRAGSRWSASQAIRVKQTGILSHWLPLTLSIEGDLLTKYFSLTVAREVLVHGHVECLRRLRVAD